MLISGTPAPAFSLPDQNEDMRSLSDYAGKCVVVFFYPRDNSAGCTVQVTGFASLLPQFDKLGCEIVGINRDSVASHKRFSDKLSLTYPLLSDQSREVLEAYGVWQEKKSYGKTAMGIVRSSVLVDEKGDVVVYHAGVKAKDNPLQMLEALRSYRGLA